MLLLAGSCVTANMIKVLKGGQWACKRIARLHHHNLRTYLDCIVFCKCGLHDVFDLIAGLVNVDVLELGNERESRAVDRKPWRKSQRYIPAQIPPGLLPYWPGRCQSWGLAAVLAAPVHLQRCAHLPAQQRLVQKMLYREGLRQPAEVGNEEHRKAWAHLVYASDLPFVKACKGFFVGL